MRKAPIAGLVALLLSGCGGWIDHHEDGEGELFSSPHSSWGVRKGIVDTGETWSAGTIPLCKSSDRPVVLQSVEAVSTTGEVRLESVLVRTTHWANPEDPPALDGNAMIGTFPGLPKGLRPAAGYVVPSTCEDTTDPVGEVVVTLTKTGEAGGRMEGLRVSYAADRGLHVFDIGFSFELCGTGGGILPCQEP
jgi:hypothetical protein